MPADLMSRREGDQQKDTCSQEMDSTDSTITFVPGAKKWDEGKDKMEERLEININDNMVTINRFFQLLALVFLIAPLSGAGELASLMTNAGVGRLDGARDYGDKREAVIQEPGRSWQGTGARQ